MIKYPTTSIGFVALSCLCTASFAQVAPPTRIPTAIPAATAPATATATAAPAAPAPTVAAPAPAAPAAPATPVTITGDNDRDDKATEGHDRRKGHGKGMSMTGTTEGDVLTVTSLKNGSLKIGTRLSGPGLPDEGIVITEFLTGTGGAGTYKFTHQK